MAEEWPVDHRGKGRVETDSGETIPVWFVTAENAALLLLFGRYLFNIDERLTPQP